MLLAINRFIEKYPYWLIAVGLGALSAFALPPFYIIPLLIPAFSILLRLHDKVENQKLKSFALGWWFGFGHFLVGLYWISFALFVDIEKFWWLVPFAFFGIAAVMALYPALVLWALSWFNVKGFHKLLLFAVLWTLTEWVRGWLFTGFPWNMIGYAWMPLNAIRMASLVGIVGVSFITICLTGFFYVGWYWSARKIQIYIVSMFYLLLIMANALTDRMPPLGTPFWVHDVNLRIVQGNIPQTFKWDPAEQYNNLQTYLQLSTSPGYEKITHFIWPESAIPYLFTDQDTKITEVLTSILPENSTLLSGVTRAEVTETGMIKKIWNSMIVLNKNGEKQFYDKRHLVPFGEYMPFRKFLPDNIQKITVGTADFTPGTGNELLEVAQIGKVRPLICYEVIFSDEMMLTKNGERPDVIINVTNDGWYGYSSGPFQHFEMSRVRAIEQGVPVIRAANTGISAVIDAYGNVADSARLETQQVIDAQLPTKTKEPPLYAQYGTKLVLIPLSAILLFYLFKNRKKRVSIPAAR